jgi:hypothetical protein
MKKCSYLAVLLSLWCCTSCFVQKQEKSESFYLENKAPIDELIRSFNTLHDKEPFAIGFSDKRFKYYTFQMYTDTVRYIYSTHMDKKLVFDEMYKSKITESEIRVIAQQIKDLKCLWIHKSDIFIDGVRTPATHLSFKSVLFNRPFDENRYYNLVFLETSIPKRTTTRRLRKYGYHEVSKNVYFTISSRFR